MVKSMREHAAIAAVFARSDAGAASRILLQHIARKEGSHWEHLAENRLGVTA